VDTAPEAVGSLQFMAFYQKHANAELPVLLFSAAYQKNQNA